MLQDFHLHDYVTFASNFSCTNENPQQKGYINLTVELDPDVTIKEKTVTVSVNASLNGYTEAKEQTIFESSLESVIVFLYSGNEDENYIFSFIKENRWFFEKQSHIAVKILLEKVLSGTPFEQIKVISFPIANDESPEPDITTDNNSLSES